MPQRPGDRADDGFAQYCQGDFADIEAFRDSEPDREKQVGQRQKDESGPTYQGATRSPAFRQSHRSVLVVPPAPVRRRIKSILSEVGSQSDQRFGERSRLPSSPSALSAIVCAALEICFSDERYSSSIS